MSNEGVALTINVSLAEIYDVLCPHCKTSLLDLLGRKAAHQGLSEAFRAQFERPPLVSPADEPQDPPQP